MLPLLAVALVSASPPAPGTAKIVVNEFEAGVGVDPKVAHVLSSSVTSELRRNPKLVVMSQDDIRGLLSLQKQKAMLSCADAACLAEIGGALGAAQIVTGSLSLLGQTYVFVLRRIDVRAVRVLRDVERRYKVSAQDALLDAIPAMVRDLLPSGSPAPDEAVGAAVEGKPGPAPWIVAGVGGVVAAAGLAMLLDAALGGHTTSGVTTYTYPGAQTANTVGELGQGFIVGGAVVAAAGIAWGLLRSSGEPR